MGDEGHAVLTKHVPSSRALKPVDVGVGANVERGAHSQNVGVLGLPQVGDGELRSQEGTP